MRRSLFGFLAALAISLPQPARALVVFDPSNFAQNVVTAAEAVKAELQRIEQIFWQTQQLATQVQNLAKLDTWLDVARDYSPEVAAALNYAGTLKQLYGELNGLHDTFELQLKEHAMSGLSWDKYVQRELALGQRKLQTAESAFGAVANAMRRLDSDYAQMRKAQDAMHADSSQGAQRQMQILNEQVNQLLSMTREMLTSIAASVQLSSEKSMMESVQSATRSQNANSRTEARAQSLQDAIDAANALRGLQDNLYRHGGAAN